MKRSLWLCGILLVFAGWTLPAFEPVPAAARKALAGSRGRPIRKGLVFVNGHYLKPPYTVARYGTAIFINNVQVTDQIVPWKTFLATQKGGVTAAPPPPPPVEKKKETVDDLFDEGPSEAEKKAEATAKTAAAETAAADSFVANEESKALVKRINARRTAINRLLANSRICFFGSRYAPVNVPSRLGRDVLAVLPEAIREAEDAQDLAGRLRAKGYVFFNADLCKELIENRADYPALIERRTQMQQDEAVQNMLDGAQGGR